jgi:hypothetical protein
LALVLPRRSAWSERCARRPPALARTRWRPSSCRSASTGLNDVLGHKSTGWDPSRVAAQIVSGIGFIGGGIIFVRRETVRRLTTAAGVWVSAGVGMRRRPAADRTRHHADLRRRRLRLTTPGARARQLAVRALGATTRLPDGQGTLREAWAECARRGFSISGLDQRHDQRAPSPARHCPAEGTRAGLTRRGCDGAARDRRDRGCARRRGQRTQLLTRRQCFTTTHKR